MTQPDSRPAIELARAQFAQQALSFPPLPAEFAGQLTPFNEYVFATRELAYGPYAMGALVGEVRGGGAVPDYALLGFDGHGVNSWAVHYAVVMRGLALFLQFAWGGAYLEADEARPVIANGFEFARLLQGAVARAVAQGRVAAGVRLVVSVSDLEMPGWGWVRPGVAAADWRSGGDVYSEVAEELQSLISAPSS